MDNGSGIVKEDLPYIFTRFYRGKNASPDSVGIGLAMAYRIITSQNGDILVHSEIGKGTTFAVRLYKK
jgi:signal transduction histidine kinase